MTISAFVIGLGKIGLGYDLEKPIGAFTLTHCRALKEHPGIEFLGASDKSAEKCSVCRTLYDIDVSTEFSSLLAALRPDLVVIACPTDAHYDVLVEVLEACSPKYILCEKPLSYFAPESVKIVEVCKARGVELFVNYMRTSNPGFIEIRNRIRDGRIQGPFKGNIWYSKGLKHNGSHFVNLMQFWFGDVQHIRKINHGRSMPLGDSEPDFVLEFENGQFIFTSSWDESYPYFSVELLSPSGRLYVGHNEEKILWYPKKSSGFDQECTNLFDRPERITTGMNFCQKHVLDELTTFVSGRENSNICSGLEALATVKVIDAIFSKEDNLR